MHEIDLKKLENKWKSHLGLNEIILDNFPCQILPKILNKYSNKPNEYMILYEVNQDVQQSIWSGKSKKNNENLLKNSKMAKVTNLPKSVVIEKSWTFFKQKLIKLVAIEIC